MLARKVSRKMPQIVLFNFAGKRFTGPMLIKTYSQGSTFIPLKYIYIDIHTYMYNTPLRIINY